ncbi:MAG: hypothetical protein M0P71_07305 [Melioribacteraceae bacterium]|jgi:hypothetical protein|nr:hypothetical protein [Melioribacteraceae bacterium]
MAQHTKIKKGTVTIASGQVAGTATIDMELSTEDMRKMEHDYALGAGLWFTRLIPTIIKTGLAGANAGALEKPIVALTIPNILFPDHVLVTLTVSQAVGVANATYDVWLEYPHSIIR